MKIILDGLTGTGKSSTIAAMRRAGLAPELVVPEEETFGDLMDEIAGGGLEGARFVQRLETITTRLEDEHPRSFLLERFHVSYYAQVPAWAHYRDIDLRLADLGVAIALLVVPDAVLKERSLLREEYGGTDWQSFATRYGSEGGAIEALRRSQNLRLEALALTRLPHLTIDTTDRTWDDYARTIATWSPGSNVTTF
jgi:hypothetical protein